MNEIWKSIEGYEGMYEVSSIGKIKGIPRKFRTNTKILKPLINIKNKYTYVQLSTGGKIKAVRVHRIVAMAFIPNTDNKPYVNHKDGNKSNNCLDNLEWVTESENTQHALDNDLIAKGEKSYLSKISLETAKYIKYSNKSVRALCNELNLKYAHVYNLRKGLIWKDI